MESLEWFIQLPTFENFFRENFDKNRKNLVKLRNLNIFFEFPRFYEFQDK